MFRYSELQVNIFCFSGDSEVQRTMLELLNQLDGFEPKQNIKVKRNQQISHFRLKHVKKYP